MKGGGGRTLRTCEKGIINGCCCPAIGNGPSMAMAAPRLGSWLPASKEGELSRVLGGPPNLKLAGGEGGRIPNKEGRIRGL